jgi:hypothetical protein
MRTRLIALTVLAICAAAAGVSLASHDTSAANSQEVAGGEERFTNYVQPTGPEITPQVAAEKAIQHVYDTEGPDARASIAATVEVAHSTEAVAAAVQEGVPPAEAQTVGSDAEQTELRQSTVYLVVMRGAFAPLVPTPRGKSGPTGNIFSMIVDAHTGFVLGLQLGGAAPRMAELGPVTLLTVDAPSIASAAVRASTKGMLLGTVYRGKAPAVGWRTVVRSGNHKVTRRTSSRGGFFFELQPGTYTLSAYRPSGKLCGRRTETIKRRHNTFVTLQCK